MWFTKFALRKPINFPIVKYIASTGGGTARICLNAVYGKPYRAEAEDEIREKRQVGPRLEAGVTSLTMNNRRYR